MDQDLGEKKTAPSNITISSASDNAESQKFEETRPLLPKSSDGGRGTSPGLSSGAMSGRYDTEGGKRGAEIRKVLQRRHSRSATDISVLSKLRDAEYVQEHFPKLDCDEVVRAAGALDSVVAVSEHTGGVASKGLKDVSMNQNIFRNVILFRNRVVKSSTLLHFAIWFVQEFGVEADLIKVVLDSLGDPDEVLLPASYSAGPKTVFLCAQHLASGFGQLETIKILVQFVTNETTEQVAAAAWVNQWSRITPANSSLTATDYLSEVHLGDDAAEGSMKRFCQPIHDATFAGYGDVTLYLLQCKAECTKQYQGITPLHFLAFFGVAGCVENRLGGEMRLIVKALTNAGKKGESVRATANMSNFLGEGAESVTPLEVAVEDNSRFPQDLLGLLAPCLSEQQHDLTYFEDIKRISDVTADGALNLVRTIAHKGKKHGTILRRFRLNAQEPGSSDVLASVFFTSPLAASEMLDLLEVYPEVEDPGHHSIPARVSMWGLIRSVPMRCTYQSDAVNKDCLMIPFWEWKTRHDREDGWHSQYMARPMRNVRNANVKNVQVVVSLLPNILDIDVFMAFSHIRKEHLATLSKKTVQGAIFCLWANLIEQVWVVDTLFRFVEMMAYIALAIAIPGAEGRASLAWTIVAGSALFQTLNTIFSIGKALHKNATAEDTTMKLMWSISSHWSVAYLVPRIVQHLLALAFAIDLSFQYGDRSQFDDRLLALCLILACWRFIWSWRLSVIGSTIYTISETFFAGAVTQMLFITAMLLISVIFALMVLSKHHTFGLAISAYRAFLFGDDFAFNDLGMDVGHEKAFDHDDGVLLMSSVCAAFLFNVIVLNIIIAIYGHEYEKNQYDTPAQFLMGRADYSVKAILAHYITQWRGKAFNQFLMATAVVLMTLSIVVGLSSKTNKFWEMWLSAICFAVAAKLFSFACIQCEWFSPEGHDAEDRKRYLWICHTRDWQAQGGVQAATDVEDKLDSLQEKFEEELGTVQTQLEDLSEKIYDMYETMQGQKAATSRTTKTK